MAENTAISWAHDTFNPWEGCTRISPACDNCYAAERAHRFGNDHLWAGELRRTSPANWRKPIRWNEEAKASGAPRRVFCASLADVFDNQAPQEWREDLWRLIEATPHLTWMLLTKRPQNVGKMIPNRWKSLAGDGYVTPPHAPKNIWFGITAEDQERLDQRGFLALRIAAALGWMAFCSAEPLLGQLDFLGAQVPATIPGRVNLLTGDVGVCGHGETGGHAYLIGLSTQPGFGLVIAGGESGPKARPSHPDWFRSLRDQCAGAGTVFHFKQWGEWRPHSDTRTAGYERPSIVDGLAYAWPDGSITEAHERAHEHGGAGWRLCRFGTSKSGRFLDGVRHDAMPEPVRELA